MKKVFYSLFLTIVILFSLGTNTFAEDTHSTTVTYTGEGTEWYKLTVPAELTPGETGTVILEGCWSSDRKVVVTADKTVELQNDINNTIKTLDIGFNGIEQSGNNYNEIYTTEGISVADIEGALFGNWSGTFYYNAEVKDNITGYELVPLEDIIDDEGIAHLNVGEQVQLEAVALYSTDIPTWESSNNSILTVTSSGLVSAVGVGTTNINYKMDNIEGSLTFIVGHALVEGYIPGLYDENDNLIVTYDESRIDVQYNNPYDSSLNITPYYILKQNYPSATKLVIPNTVKKIGEMNLYNCSDLKEIIIPDSVTYIAERAFYGCSSLETMTIPGSVSAIYRQTFDGCSNLKSIIFSEGIKSIAHNILSGNKYITSIDLPSSINSIHKSAFDGTNISSVNIHPDNQNYCSQDGVVFTKNMKTLVLYPYKKTGNYIIPNGVTSFGLAFSGNRSITKLTIPEGITNIDDGALRSCENLKTLIIPKSITNIGKNACNASGLENIYYRGTVEEWKKVTKGEYWTLNCGTITYHYDYTN